MKRFEIQLLIVLLMICQFSKGQGKIPEDYGIAWKTNISNDLNIGRINLSIPMYNVNLGETSLNGSYDYERGGWRLNVFGKITIAYKKPGSLHSPAYKSIKEGAVASTVYNCLVKDPKILLSKKEILDNPNVNIQDAYEPNTFYFDFLGYNGYFVYDNTGKFLVYSENGNFQVTYNGQKCFNATEPLMEFPEILIKDDKGNEYYFGGDFNSTDVYYGKTKHTYSYSYDNGSYTQTEDYYTNKRVNYISAFYLKKVKLSNGRVLEAFYANGNKSILDPFTNGLEYINADYPTAMPDVNILKSNNLYMDMDLSGEFNSMSTNVAGQQPIFADRSTTEIFQKLAILDSIKISDYGTLSLFHDRIDYDALKFFHERQKTPNSYHTVGRVKKLLLKDKNNKVIRNIEFNYNKRSLTPVFITNNGEEYGFEYGWGGITSIRYPAGGRKEFEYEDGDISKSNDFIYGNYGAQNILKNVERKAGRRIKKITTFDNTSAQPQITKYSYKNDDGKSSGISTFNPISSKFSTSGGWLQDNVAYTTTGNRGGYDSEIRYSKVTEEIEGKEKNEYYFTDIITNPDSIATKVYYNTPTDIYKAWIPMMVNKNHERGKLYKKVSYDANNVPVFTQYIKYTNFLNNANPIKQYSENCNDCRISDDRFYIESDNRIWQAYNGHRDYYGFYQYQPVIPYLPSSIRTIELVNPNSPSFLETKKYIKYNTLSKYWHPYAIETTEYLPTPWDVTTNTSANGEKKISKLLYAHDLVRNSCSSGNCPADNDLVGGKFSTYKYMTDNHLVNPVIEIETNTKGKTELMEYQYIKDAFSYNLLKIGKIRKSLLNSNFSSDNPSSAEVEDKMSYELYDKVGNLLQSKGGNSIPTTVLYGYHQTLPIVEVVGATYSQVMTAFNLDPSSMDSYLQLDIVKKSNLDKDIYSEESFASALNEFKNNPALKDFKITGYVYDPLVGIKTVIQPSGIKESYEYDTLSRPSRILNEDKNILKEYNYNYKESLKYFNAERSKTFVGNNCKFYQDAIPYNYIVPQGSYISFKQGEVEPLAEKDINEWGQKAADTYGACTNKPYDCTISTDSRFYDNSSYFFNRVYYNNYDSYVGLIRFNTTNHNWGAIGQGNQKIGQIKGICKPRTFKSYRDGDWLISIDSNGDIYASWWGIFKNVTPNEGVTLSFKIPFE
ncbi:DUF5977 domain-containing protein [Chryseobacterium sp. c4a]|uniref:DUF5977 domain-containing protein n=1 Tax=Chryseobacterium sp. c4a TaxID=1573582 RepID=UPI001356AC60|nr:DUF5977 domain-containing protein [Chryseobacterium sp. c4a]